ncbi:MAG: DEAD/DEAH box helicase [Anaerolineae bacterium]|nr:DEAD/DEAH box helicase [Anaerolineae bacterium]
MNRRADAKRGNRASRRDARRAGVGGRGARSTLLTNFRPRADPRLQRVFAAIGVPEAQPFEPDPFQVEAVDAIQHADCLVTAPTGAGKTWIAVQAIRRTLERGGRAWYASPLKALSNAKHAELGLEFGPELVGILTGDRKENADAPIIVGTTEILRNQLYDAMHHGENLATDLVVLDEAHFMGDPDRGVVWEEIMIYLPRRIGLLLLSATIGNADEIAAWLHAIRQVPCVVIEAEERPVELYPLFLHPTGTLLPLIGPGARRPRLDNKVRAYVGTPNPPLLYDPRDLPPFGDIIRLLRKYRLLPAIFFLKSRADCDRALDLCRGNHAADAERQERLRTRIHELVAASPHLARHHQLWHLRNLAVGAHHGGQLPPWKLVLETLMGEGLLDAVFATSTVAAGVNFPARTVAFFHSDRFNGREFVPLTPTEFHQMVGRAGRRGMDHIGFMLAVPGPTMDLELVAELLGSPPSDVPSQVQISFSMVLNLLLSYAPAEIEDILHHSFAAYQQVGGRYRRLVREFRRHLAFLESQGYVTAQGALTETGLWASLLRIDQPLLVAEGLRRELLPASDPVLLAALMASFVHERETDENLDRSLVPRELERAFVTVRRGLHGLAIQIQRAGFEVRPLYLRPAAAMHAWASGAPWYRAVAISQMADGDMTMLVSRTADNLRHVQALYETFPRVAAAARQAVLLIHRDPVIWD